MRLYNGKANLIPFNIYDKEELKVISIKGGIARQEQRRHQRELRHELKILLSINDLKKSVKAMHFRNGHITEDQIKEYKYYIKKVYHNKLNYLKINNDAEGIEDLKEFYKHVKYKKQIKYAMQTIKEELKEGTI